MTPRAINSDALIKAVLFQNVAPSPEGDAALSEALDELLALYPDVPALGSPYGTGNETFGLATEYKQMAAIRKSVLPFRIFTGCANAMCLSLFNYSEVGDWGFHAHNRELMKLMTETGHQVFGYHFTDHDVVVPPPLTVEDPKSLGGKLVPTRRHTRFCTHDVCCCRCSSPRFGAGLL